MLDLDFVRAPASGYNVKIYEAKYRSAVDVPPQVIGVAYPKDIDISKPLAFLVFFKHIPGQDPTASVFKYFDPFGFDWLYYEIWSFIVFNGALNPSGAALVDMPFLSDQQSMGVADENHLVRLPALRDGRERHMEANLRCHRARRPASRE